MGLHLLGMGTAEAKVLVLESHSIPRTAEAGRMTQVVIGALGVNAVQEQALRGELDRAYGRRPRSLAAKRQAALLEKLKAGAQASNLGEWAKAIGLLEAVRRSLVAEVLAVSRSKALLAALQRARLLLAGCYQRVKRKDDASRAMEEVLRTQPDHVVALAEFPPSVVRLYHRVKRALDELPSASLQVTSDPAGALVFLSGRYVGVSPLKIEQLYAGRYDLLLIRDNRPSRVQRIDVSGPRKVRVDLGLQRAIASTSFTGLIIAESKGREVREMRYAMDIAARFAATRIVLIGRRKVGGREALVGKSIPLEREAAPITAYVFLDHSTPPDRTLRSLGRFLGGLSTKPGPGIVVGSTSATGAGGPHPARRTAPNHRRGLAIAGITLLGVGVAASIAGGVLLGIHNHTIAGDDGSTHSKYQTDTEGYISLGAGLGTAVVGATLLLISRFVQSPTQKKPTTQLWMTPVRGGSMVVLGGHF